MKCFKCGAAIEAGLGRKIPFRAECSSCRASLHSCRGCKYYKVGMKNDCMVYGTEFVSDREAMNFCEEFSYGEKNIAKDTSAAKKHFDDLFK